MINIILQFLELDLVNITVSAKVYQNFPNGLRVKFHCFRIWTSTNPKCGLTISWATSCQYQCVCKISSQYSISSRDRAIFTFSEFGARQSLDRWKISFRNLLGYILLISMFTQKSIKIFHSVQEMGLFSLFQNLNLGNPSANPKWHLTISWATSCQYQCICKILSKYSKWFKSYRHLSRTGRRQNLHKLSGDIIKCLIIGHSMKFNFKFQLTFLGSCNLLFLVVK